jgi:anti-anti-sigma factor
MHDCADDVEIERLATGTSVSFNRELSRAPVFGDEWATHEEPYGSDDELLMELRERGNGLMLVLTGPIDMTSSAVLRRQLQNLTRGGSTPLSMNLGAVTHIGSSGVDVLYEVAEEMRHAGHTMQLVAPSGTTAHHVLELSGLESITQHLEHDRLPDEGRARN